MRTEDVFTDLVRLREGPRTVLWAARRRSDGRSVVLKRAGPAIPVALADGRMRREYELGSRARREDVVEHLEVLALVEGPTLVLDRPAGRTLRERLDGGGLLPLTVAVRVTAAIATALSGVHATGIVHRDINPSNVLADDEGHVWLLDFGIASPVPRSEEAPRSVSTIEATLAYAAPEQTGRLSRVIDTRADLYSLGATLFEAVAGRPPYVNQDPLALVHAHVASPTPSLRTFRPDVPEVLDAIVARCLAKDPDDRYRTAAGLAHDLRRVLTALDAGERPDVFALGQQDMSSQPVAPRHLFGREAELARLDEVLDQTSRGAVRLVRVSGPTGIGKSALVEEIRRRALRRGGRAGHGRFDPLRRDTPYHAIADAIRDLLRGLFAQSEVEVRRWREALTSALASHAGSLIPIVPELRAWTQEAAAPAQEEPAAARERIRQAFTALLGAMSGDGVPLVLTLDDGQWMDPASADLLGGVLGDPAHRGLLVLLTERPDSAGIPGILAPLDGPAVVARSAPLAFELGPLSTDGVRLLVAAALGVGDSAVAEGAALVRARTGGNPFFTVLFLRSACDAGWLTPDPSGAAWRWDLPALSAAAVTENVATLAADRLSQLSARAARVAGGAARLGRVFDVGLVAQVCGLDDGAVREDLEHAARLDILTSLGEGDRYRFGHDRLRDAAADLLDGDQKDALDHLAGKVFADRWEDQGEGLDDLFAACMHLGQVLARLTPAERARALALHDVAGRRAHDSAAFDTAARLRERALDLAPPDAWTVTYSDQLQRCCDAASSAYPVARFDLLDRASSEVAREATSAVDRATMARIVIVAHAIRGDNARAVATAVESLRDLGHHVPAKVGLHHVIGELARARWTLRGRGPDDLMDMPACAEPNIVAAQAVLSACSSAAYFLSPLTVTVVLLRSLSLAARYGPTPGVAFSFAGYGLVLTGILGRIDEGYRWGVGAGKAITRLNAPALACRVAFLHNNFIAHWRESLDDTRRAYAVAWTDGLTQGDPGFATGCMLFSATHGLHGGLSLEECGDELSRFEATFVRTAQLRSLPLLRMLRRSVDDLVVGPKDGEPLEDERFSARATLAEVLPNDRTTPFWVHLHRAWVHRLWGDAERAATDLLAAEAHVRGAPGQALLGVFHLHLALTGVERMAEGTADRAWRRRVTASRRLLARWSTHNPGLYAHRVLWIDAARASGDGDPTGAWARAIEACAAARIPAEHALCAEHAARWADGHGMSSLAHTWRSEAWRAWSRWGARSRADRLAKEFPMLLVATSDGGAEESTTSLSFGAQSLDLDALLRATRALSGEIRLDALLGRVCTLLVQAASADRLTLVRVAREGLRVDARTVVSGDAIEVTRCDEVLGKADLLASWLAPVAAGSGMEVDLPDVANDARWGALATMAGLSVRAALAIPLRSRGDVVAVAVIENAHTPGAFTGARMDTVRALAAQAAVSLENAQLYEAAAALARASERFVPKAFLELLGKESVVDVRLGDSTLLPMSVLFMDLRGFTAMSEGMTPEQVFAFVNAWLGEAEPVLRRHGGFVDKYIGDAILGLFPGGADDAVRAAIDLWHVKESFNARRAAMGDRAIGIGVGINHGRLALGTVGGEHRMEGTVISDVVNVASRVEGMTKTLGATILITGETRAGLRTPASIPMRRHGTREVRGRRGGVELWEVLVGQPERVTQSLALRDRFEAGVDAHAESRHADAARAFDDVLEELPDDAAAAAWRSRCTTENHTLGNTP